MEEKDNLSSKNIINRISIIRKINRGHENIKLKLNKQKTLYFLIFLVILLLFIIIIFLIIENKKLLHKIIEKKNKDKHFTLDFISDNEKIFGLSKNIFKFKGEKEIEINNLNQIHISYSLDNKLIFPTLVSMLSGLENNNKSNNIIIYHLLLSHDFNISKVEIFESLKMNYIVKINYYIIPHIFSYSLTWTAGTDCVYYKILLPIMFPYLERILYIDGDTLIRKDLSELINYPFGDNYILGFPFYMTHLMDKHGINATHYINAGCVLFNIDKIRKDNKDIDLLQFTIKKNNVLSLREQDSINYVFHPNIGFLPLKYGIYMIGSEKTFKSLSGYTRSPLDLTEGYEAVKDPSIVHFSCCWPKVWTQGSKNLFKENEICERYKNEFYFYANKTQYYSEIYNQLYFDENYKK